MELQPLTGRLLSRLKPVIYLYWATSVTPQNVHLLGSGVDYPHSSHITPNELACIYSDIKPLKHILRLCSFLKRLLFLRIIFKYDIPICCHKHDPRDGCVADTVRTHYG